MRFYYENWRNITGDPSILDAVHHCHIEFLDGLNPVQSFCKQSKFNPVEDKVVNEEIKKLLEMQVIKVVDHHPQEFISPIFVVPKKNPGEYRMILNLKKLNESIPYCHFKMDTFESVLKLVKPGCYMASIDLRHAYYSVFIAEEDQVKLRFEKSNVIYQFQCLPNGIAFAPRLFTKIMKPVYASLRVRGYTNSGYIDDSFLAGDTYNECKENVTETVQLMTDVGFMIHKEKSVLVPTKNLTFLGNDIDSENMIVTLPKQKVMVLCVECIAVYNKSQVSIKIVARLLGLMVSSLSAVEYGRLFYRKIEREKIDALKRSKGDFSHKMLVTDDMRVELKWWIDNLLSQNRVIARGNSDITVTTDASTLGWAGSCENKEIGGRWSVDEAKHHINYLEFLAASLSVRAFCRDKHDVHVQVLSDNSCTVAYIKNMGGCKSMLLNELANKLWCWCIERSIWLSASYIPGKDNVSDHGSRNFNENVEWKLNNIIFQRICSLWGVPSVDMFASRLNKQLEKYVSWGPDAEAFVVDAFSFDWSKMFVYIFCPFSVVAQVLQKLSTDKAECIMILPGWPTQNWWNRFLSLLVDSPYIIPVTPEVLQIPNTDKIHPLVNSLNLVACRLSGDPLKAEKYQKSLPKLSCHHGNRVLKNSMQCTSKNGFTSVIRDSLVQFKLL